MHLNVRFAVGTDVRYARCECGEPACVHLVVAQALEAALAPGADGGLVSIDGDSPTAVESAVVEEARRAWRDWLGQLLEVGISAVDHLLGSAIRLASAWEGTGLPRPAAALREIGEQLEHHRAHDAQLAPDRMLTLIGEVEARLTSLATPDAPAPHQVVGGPAETTTRQTNVRLMGLGAEFVHVGGWNQLRVHLLDLRTGAVSSLVTEADDTAGNQVGPGDLLARRVQSVGLGDWASGLALVPSLRRTGAQLSIGRGRVSVAPTDGFDAPTVSGVAPRTLAEVDAALPDLPDVLGPRGSTDSVMVLPVAGLDEVEVSGSRSRVTARLVDHEGATATVLLPWGPRTEAGAVALHAALTDPERSVLAVAGRWQRTHGGLRVVPTAVWTDRGVLLPQARGGASYTATGPMRLDHDTSPDVWRQSWDQVTDLLSALLVLGGRRGAARLGRDLAAACADLQARGLSRTADLVDQLANGVAVPERRIEGVAALCVRLALLD